MSNQTVLNKLEHFLLSSVVGDIEPLYILYSEAIRDIEGSNLDLILEALVKLVDAGLTNCFFQDDKPPNTITLCENITIDQLKKHCSNRTEEELREYPEYRDGESDGEYNFEATDKGKLEESKDIYEKYYINDD